MDLKPHKNPERSPSGDLSRFFFTENLNASQIRQLHRHYSREWWTKTRTLKQTRKVVDGSSLIFAYLDEKDRLAAFARVLSDFVFKASIFDLIVSEDYRNAGLGKALIEKILNHPRLEEVASFELYCLPEMSSYYQGLGFEELNDQLILMRRNNLKHHSHTG
jgi:ribosomal protein S18 acetylase RimI-like enzyme